MFRVLVAPEFEISAADPDFPRDLLETLKTARDYTGCKYVSFWAQMGDSDLVSLIVVSTYPASWLHRYDEMNYSRIDPTLTKGLKSVNAVVFKHADPGCDDLKDFGADALAHGIGKYTISIPVHVGQNVRSVVTFTTDFDVMDDTDEACALITRCREQANIVSLAILERFMKPDPLKYKLTEREIEVLYWGSCGKTDQQTADIMGLSRWTVVAHVQSAKSKLRVNNKAAAISRALKLNLLDRFEQKL